MAQRKAKKTTGSALLTKGKARCLPRSVRVGSHKLKVIRREIPDDEACAGYFTSDSRGSHIAVDSRLNGTRELEVFIHELIHAVDYYCGGADLPHRQVNSLAAGLCGALKPYLKFK